MNNGSEHEFVPLSFQRRDVAEMEERARAFYADIRSRRSVREFAPDPVPREVIDDCIRAAGTAPSGAHKQPWTFVVVEDQEVKRRVREAAEEEERENYGGRMNEQWLADLAPLGTDERKPFLEVAPLLIVVFRHAWGREGEGRTQNYYTQESVGIASGFLLAALHQAGLATLTHTPSPMGFLGKILGRPENEKAFLLIPVGYPAEGCRVPALERKALDSIRVWH